jgi:hypothetical protein
MPGPSIRRSLALVCLLIVATALIWFAGALAIAAYVDVCYNAQELLPELWYVVWQILLLLVTLRMAFLLFKASQLTALRRSIIVWLLVSLSGFPVFFFLLLAVFPCFSKS